MSHSLPNSVIPLYEPGDSVEDVVLKLDRPVPGLREAFPIPYSQSPGYSPIFRNKYCLNSLYNLIHPNLKTGFDIFQNALARSPNRNFLAHRKFNKNTNSFDPHYSYFSHQQVADLAASVGSGILFLLQNVINNIPNSSENPSAEKPIVTLYLPNCYQFIVLDLAFQGYNLPSTTLYDTLGKAASCHILTLTGSPIVFSTKSKILLLATLKTENKVDTLKVVVVNEDLDLSTDYKLFQEAKAANFILYDLKTVAAIGNTHLKPFTPSTQDDVYTIAFTSGTTGTPKGAILTQKNLMSFYVNTLDVFTSCTKYQQDNRAFVFLPLAHCFARFCFYYEVIMETTFYFPHQPTNTPTYFEDIKIVKPATLCLVPRVLSKIELLLKAKFSTSKFLSNIINTKIAKINNGENYSHFIYDNFICKKIRAALGFENLREIMSGGAQVSKDTLIFLKAALNIDVLQGYGLTETAAGVAVSSPLLENYGVIGPSGAASEIKLRDVPEMDYTFDSNRSGEILVRGYSIAAGYYKQPEKFKETIEDGGWYRTGDIGKFDENNRLAVIDRIKNFFKLAQGKYIAAEKIENIYISSNLLIEQIFLYGDGLQYFLVAIVGVNAEYTQTILQKKGIEFAEFEQVKKAVASNVTNEFTEKFVNFLNELKIKKVLLQGLNSNINEDLTSYEYIKNVHFAITPFSVEHDTMTPTLKVKRNSARKQYQEVIDDLYKQGSIVNSTKL